MDTQHLSAMSYGVPRTRQKELTVKTKSKTRHDTTVDCHRNDTIIIKKAPTLALSRASFVNRKSESTSSLHSRVLPINKARTQKQNTKSLEIKAKQGNSRWTFTIFDTEWRRGTRESNIIQSHASVDLGDYNGMISDTLSPKRVQQQLYDALSELNEKCETYKLKAIRAKTETECILASSGRTQISFSSAAFHFSTRIKTETSRKAIFQLPFEKDVPHSYTPFVQSFKCCDAILPPVQLRNVLR